MTSFAPVQAANSSSSASLKVSSPQLINLKLHQNRLALHRERMIAAGSADSLSEELLAVHNGLQSGKYMYDIDTARKVFQEVYADMMPSASAPLTKRLQSLPQLTETEIQSNTQQ